MTVNEARKIYCIGIGGIGVSALAQLWHTQGKQLSGSDAAESELTRELKEQGIPVISGGKASGASEALPLDIDLVVYSDAVPEDHPQRVAARAAGVPEISYAQALGEVSREYRTIVVTGTHGKSTTTALLGLMLEAAGLDPLVIVGTKVPQWSMGNLRLPSQFRHSERSANEVKNPVRLGTGSFAGLRMTDTDAPGWFVVEGDDYRDHFLELQPYAVVVTNIEHDHPDYFQDLEHTVESFTKLVEKVPQEGFVVMNEDDAGCHKLHSAILQNRRMIKYGRGSEIFKTLPFQVPGEFNRYNATAAATAVIELGASQDVVERVIREFKGVWRRFEIVGQIKDLRFKIKNAPLVISDYGHHPTAIRVTMQAARQFYPDRRLVLVYQPHQHSRTKHLFNDFVRVLRDAADVVIVSDIYAVKGRMEDRNVSGRDIVEALSPHPLALSRILYGGNLRDTKTAVLKNVQPGDVLIFMGAGDIDDLARSMSQPIALSKSHPPENQTIVP